MAREKQWLNLVIFLIWIAAAAGCGGAQTTAAGERVEDRVPSDPFLLLPAECTAGLYLDVASMRKSSFYYGERKTNLVKDLNPGERRLVEYFLEHTRALAMGFSFEGRKAFRKPQWVLVLEGDFQEAGLSALLADLARTGEVAGLKWPAAPNPESQGRYREFFADRKRRGLILDERVVVFGNRQFLPRVLGLASGGGAGRFVDGDLYRSMAQLSAFGKSTLSAVFAVPGQVAKQIERGSGAASLFAQYEEAIKGITAVGARLDLKGGMTLDLFAETASAEYPPRLVEIANALIFAASLAQQDRNVLAVIENTVVRADGLRAHLRLKASDEQVAAIVELARKKQQEEEREKLSDEPPTVVPPP